MPVLFFAALRDRTGTGAATLSLTKKTSVGAVLAAVAAQFPAAAGLVDSCRVALNGEFVDGRIQLQAGDELAVLPPVAGG